MDLYMVAVILNPTAREKKAGKHPELVVEPKGVMANDEQHAVLKAHRLVPEQHVDKDDRLEVRVCPFPLAV